MSWQQKVPGSFGSEDCIFAGHPLDEERARVAIKEAKASGATRDEFEKEAVYHVYKKTVPGVARDDRFEKLDRALKRLWK